MASCGLDGGRGVFHEGYHSPSLSLPPQPTFVSLSSSASRYRHRFAAGRETNMEADKAGSDEVLLFISRLPASFLNAQLLARLQTLRVCARACIIHLYVCLQDCVYVSRACQSVYVFARTCVYVCTSACVCER